MSQFQQQLLLTIIDKGAIGLLLLIAGFLLNRFLEKYKNINALQNEKSKTRDTKRLEFLDKQLSQFYYPIYIRLQIDNVVWRRILDRDDQDELKKKVGVSIDKNLILPNHQEIVKFIEGNIHLAGLDDEFFEVTLKYVRHVAVYQAMRDNGYLDQDPIHLGEPWPKEFFPLVERRVKELQDQYSRLMSEVSH